MDKVRLTGFSIRQACDRLERELNAVLAGDMTDSRQREATLARVAELRHQADTWLAIATGALPATHPRREPPDGSLIYLRPLHQTAPRLVEDAQNHAK